MEIIIGVIIGLFFLIGIFIPYIINPRYKFNKSDYEASQTTSKALVDAIIKAASDKAASDKATSDKVASDKAASDKVASEKAEEKEKVPEKVAENEDKKVEEDVNCEMSPFTAYSACSAACGGGTQTRTRTITREPKGKGIPCGLLSETQSCNTQACPPTDTEVEFTSTRRVASQQGNQQTTRTPSTPLFTRISFVPVGDAPIKDSDATSPINTINYLEDCKKNISNVFYDASINHIVYGHKSSRIEKNPNAEITLNNFVGTTEPPTCEYPVLINNSASSNNQEGYVLAYRHDSLENLPFRYTNKDTENLGLSNPKKFRMSSADRGTDCEMSPFVPDGECSKPCGGGTQKYIRSITKQPTGNGKPCESLEIFEVCNAQACDSTQQNGNDRFIDSIKPLTGPVLVAPATPPAPANTPGALSPQEPVDYLADCKELMPKVFSDMYNNRNVYGYPSGQISKDNTKEITLDTSDPNYPTCDYPVYINEPRNNNPRDNYWKPYLLKYHHNSLESLPLIWDDNTQLKPNITNPKIIPRSGAILQ